MQIPPPDRYKRLFPVQLTPAESDLLDRLGLEHGTKRQAVLDGLRLLGSGELETLRARVITLEGERDAAAAEATAGRAAHLAEARTSREASKTIRVQLREERSAVRSARAELRQTRQDLASARQDLVAAQAEAGRLTALVPHHAFCTACGKYVPEAEWAEQPDPKGGVHVNHRPHGLRTKATLTQLPSLLFWRATPRLGTP